MSHMQLLEEVIAKAAKDRTLCGSAIEQFSLLTKEIYDLREQKAGLIKQNDTLKDAFAKIAAAWQRNKYPFKIFGNRRVTIIVESPKKKKKKDCC